MTRNKDKINDLIDITRGVYIFQNDVGCKQV